MNTVRGPYLVWFDTEYTSLDLEQARLAQVAMVVTDFEGRRIAPAEQDLVTPVRLPAEAPVLLRHLMRRWQEWYSFSKKYGATFIQSYLARRLSPPPLRISSCVSFSGASPYFRFPITQPLLSPRCPYLRSWVFWRVCWE